MAAGGRRRRAHGSAPERALTLPLPSLLAATARDAPDPERARWLAGLPAAVAELTARWQFEVGPPYEPGGTAAWVAPARDRAGQELALKVGWRHDEAEHEAEGLAVWAGRGTVLLHRAEHLDVRTTALLLERCVPGTSLAASAAPDVQDDVVAGLLRRTWVDPPAGGPFRDLADMCAWWADAAERRYAERAGASDPAARLDPGVVRAGLALFRELPRTADRRVLLTTDLHGGNVLAASREAWLAVDPKPYAGDPAYDPLQHLLQDVPALCADPRSRARGMAARCGLDPSRVEQWLCARCVVEAPLQPALAAVAAALAP